MQDKEITSGTASRLRQRLRVAYDELGSLLPTFFARDDVFPGYVTKRAVRCGKPSCHCVDGARHAAWTVTQRVAGRARSRALPDADRESVKALADTYRGVRLAQRKWRKLVREIDGIVDELLESRAVAYERRTQEEE